MKNRAAFQVLVIPFAVLRDGRAEYAVFRRSDGGYWQFIAGGGEGAETPLAAARREAWEEAGIDPAGEFISLAATASIPVVQVAGFLWGPDVLVIPEHAFAVEASSRTLCLSAEHSESRWVDYPTVLELLKWDSNRTAVWELNHRLQSGLLPRRSPL